MRCTSLSGVVSLNHLGWIEVMFRAKSCLSGLQKNIWVQQANISLSNQAHNRSFYDTNSILYLYQTFPVCYNRIFAQAVHRQCASVTWLRGTVNQNYGITLVNHTMISIYNCMNTHFSQIIGSNICSWKSWEVYASIVNKPLLIPPVMKGCRPIIREGHGTPHSCSHSWNFEEIL